ncbi:conserved hypothetical protein [Ricinus communis]|uniref:Uncharacterized protein n=1 Tax=Ricinus communis TaxID=3988 RepID=B9RWW4_RICCO|nr:conserved hypothetical protein [Ricinus communis]
MALENVVNRVETNVQDGGTHEQVEAEASSISDDTLRNKHNIFVMDGNDGNSSDRDDPECQPVEGKRGRPRKKGNTRAQPKAPRLAPRNAQPRLRKPNKKVDPQVANEFRERFLMPSERRVNYVIGASITTASTSMQLSAHYQTAHTVALPQE